MEHIGSEILYMLDTMYHGKRMKEIYFQRPPMSCLLEEEFEKDCGQYLSFKDSRITKKYKKVPPYVLMQ
ncbi:hypothetical protein SS50377_23968 [Spironucleus salmonicida]|uniref:Uncharacterized protein n=1 Tax=Spironucleus salmonicida TaxID=348837 RepID=V6LGU1_9EUKA|nr:hypothetical protein SS50377_23968 [Spironucleus salmonicida]|eukprot:EST42926.1 Hypothetical protein SS50377_17458 [Spironucleus salmonicida]